MSKDKITPKNILHQNRKKEEKITLENILEKASTDNVSDAMKNLYGVSGVIEDVKPIDPKYKVVGKIRTVITNSNDWGTGIKAIYESEKDEILFFKCSDDSKAIWGEMASKAAKEYGIKATVIYGASRDTAEIIELGYKVFSQDIKSNAGKPLNEGIIDTEIRLNNTSIHSGDILIGDIDGVVIIPQDKIDDVLEEVNNIKKFENECIKRLLKDHENLDSILKIN